MQRVSSRPTRLAILVAGGVGRRLFGSVFERDGGLQRVDVRGLELTQLTGAVFEEDFERDGHFVVLVLSPGHSRAKSNESWRWWRMDISKTAASASMAAYKIR